jgi:hypothetical protein
MAGTRILCRWKAATTSWLTVAHDSLAAAEVRDGIVQRWAAEYDRRAADLEIDQSR